MHILSLKRHFIFATIVFITTILITLSSSASAQVAPTVCDADLNDDHIVNLLDYSMLVAAFNPIGPTNSPADLNKDTKVNLLDFTWLKAFFFQSCAVIPSPTPVASPSPSPVPSPTTTPAPTPIPNVDISISVETSTARPISPYIFGTNGGSYTRTTLSRAGGNRWTAYNWENNASNAGTDWQNSSDNYLCSAEAGYVCPNSTTPGAAIKGRIDDARNKNAASLITIPIVDYVAADKNGSVNSVASPSNTRWAINELSSSSEGNTPNYGDRNVFQAQFVNFIETSYPNTHNGSNPEIFYSLDNEPGLWPSTHPLVHGAKPTYAEMVERSVEYASMIKNRAPQAKVFGSVAYGYNEFQTLQDATDRNSTAPGQVGSTYLDYFLASMRNASNTAGKQLMDVLDLHWYPEAKDPITGCRITDCASDTESKVQARVQAPRSLWDDNYRENSWIANDYLNGPIRLIPDINTRIGHNYSGTKLSFSEYYYGGGNHISGAIAQADVLGIFAKEDVFAANLWELHSNNQFIYAAFDMYRNYDGAGSKVGTHIVSLTNSDTVKSSAYAMKNGSDNTKVYVVVINKNSSPQNIGITLNHPTTLTTAEVYELSGNVSTPQTKAALSVNNNTVVYPAPAYSVTTLVFR